MFWVQKIAIWSHCPGEQKTTAELCAPTTTHAFSDQAPFIFSNSSTDLEQQLVMGILTHGTLQKLDLTTQILELLNEQYLMDVIACQSIWRCDENHLKLSLCGMFS